MAAITVAAVSFINKKPDRETCPAFSFPAESPPMPEISVSNEF
jgi:hypothetical protein